MKRERFLISVLVFLLLSAIASTISVVHAKESPIIEATGVATATEPFEVTGFRTADGNRFITGAFTDDLFTGTFEGSADNVFSLVLNPSGLNVQLVFTFTGTVAGREGTCLIKFQGNGVGIGEPISGTWTILSGTGDLANLHGTLKVEGRGGVILNYDGLIHFDP